MAFQASELILDDNGHVYHLGIGPENIGTKIILVGDQDRVALVSSFFDTIEHRSQHREFVTHTGTYKGKRVTVLSTGIGTDNLDIVMNELDAAVNVDLTTREEKVEKTQLEIIRIGTCGILQQHIPIHTYILSEASLGLDNIAHFYEINFSKTEQEMCEKITQHIQLPEKVIPYYVEADKEMVNRLKNEKTAAGITITSSGFYGPQGRQIILKTKTTELNDRLTSFSHDEMRINNFEMESSALFVLSKALGHKATAICLGIANRARKEFSKGYKKEMDELIQFVLDRI